MHAPHNLWTLTTTTPHPKILSSGIWAVTMWHNHRPSPKHLCKNRICISTRIFGMQNRERLANGPNCHWANQNSTSTCPRKTATNKKSNVFCKKCSNVQLTFEIWRHRKRYWPTPRGRRYQKSRLFDRKIDRNGTKNQRTSTKIYAHIAPKRPQTLIETILRNAFQKSQICKKLSWKFFLNTI